MRRSPLKASTRPMKRTAFVRGARQRLATEPKPRQLTTRQRHVTKADKALWDQIAGLGCVACYLDGHASPVVCIHHIDGRTKPGCHKLVLPLCAGHHQDGTGEDKTLVAVHPYKARFEALYGPQMTLLVLVLQQIQQPAPGGN